MASSFLECCDGLFPVSSHAASLASPAASDADSQSGPDPSAQAQAMNRLLDALVHGIPTRFHVECASCLFWRGAGFGIVITLVVGAAVLGVWSR